MKNSVASLENVLIIENTVRSYFAGCERIQNRQVQSKESIYSMEI